MTATAVLVIIVGLFVILNAPNFVGVIKGDKKIAFQGAGANINAQGGVGSVPYGPPTVPSTSAQAAK